MSFATSIRFKFIILLQLVSLVSAHPHHGNGGNSEAPIDAVLWIHIVVQLIVWGGIFGIGMVLGITRSKWHVPVQSVAYLMTAAGYILGHSHKGRSFPESAHGRVANFILFPLLAQLALGIYLKLHIHEQTIRPWAVVAHGIIGKSWLVIGWTQMLLGAIVLRGYCGKEELGQCLAHYIMGSAFIGYGVLLAVVLLAGGGRVWYGKRWRDGGKGEKVVSPRSQEWWDGWVIMLWGIVNTFTEHHGPLTKWSHKDMQHTTLGVICKVGRRSSSDLPSAKRETNDCTSADASCTHFPPCFETNTPHLFSIIMTGWAMSSHSQAMEISTKVHTIFGVVLMSAGVARIIEITFVLKDAASISDVQSTRPARKAKPVEIQAFQHLPPFLLVAGGILFMSATDEELKAVMGIEMDHVTYVLLMLSLAFVIYLYANLLLHIYASSGRNATGTKKTESTAGYTPLALRVDSSLAAPTATTPNTAFTPAPAYPGRPMDMEEDSVYKISDDRDSFEEEMEMDDIQASEQGRLALR
ncbi:unnamed protein product [Rhizoctonia solani]|uniref:Protein YTP1 n=1 Tax=Rhizoctonia solani TaxID=456999 RepID=A0A8H3D7Y4_9AGAM|nr:unnamed protein product [Rhizoctonia solani]